MAAGAHNNGRAPRFLVRGSVIRRFQPSRDDGLIGRDHGDVGLAPDILLDGPEVSRRHAVWRWSSEGAIDLRDAGSSYGTTVDGVPLGSSWTRLTVDAAVDFGGQGAPWHFRTEVPHGLTRTNTHKDAVLSFHPDRSLTLQVGDRVQGSLRGKTAFVLEVLAREYTQDRKQEIEEHEAGWLTRPDWQFAVEGITDHSLFRKGTVSTWIGKARAELEALRPGLDELLQDRRGDSGAGGATPGMVRLLPPAGGFSFPER